MAMQIGMLVMILGLTASCKRLDTRNSRLKDWRAAGLESFKPLDTPEETVYLDAQQVVDSVYSLDFHGLGSSSTDHGSASSVMELTDSVEEDGATDDFALASGSEEICKIDRELIANYKKNGALYFDGVYVEKCEVDGVETSATRVTTYRGYKCPFDLSIYAGQTLTVVSRVLSGKGLNGCLYYYRDVMEELDSRRLVKAVREISLADEGAPCFKSEVTNCMIQEVNYVMENDNWQTPQSASFVQRRFVNVRTDETTGLPIEGKVEFIKNNWLGTVEYLGANQIPLIEATDGEQVVTNRTDLLEDP
jgi:hypothetical protein